MVEGMQLLHRIGHGVGFCRQSVSNNRKNKYVLENVAEVTASFHYQRHIVCQKSNAQGRKRMQEQYQRTERVEGMKSCNVSTSLLPSPPRLLLPKSKNGIGEVGGRGGGGGETAEEWGFSTPHRTVSTEKSRCTTPSISTPSPQGNTITHTMHGMHAWQMHHSNNITKHMVHKQMSTEEGGGKRPGI